MAGNILVVNYEYPPLGGGGAVACKQIAKGLTRFFNVHVLTCGANGLPPETEDKGVTVHRLPVLKRDARATASFASMFSYLPLSLIFGRRLMKRLRFDLVNTWFAVPSGPSGLILSKWFGVPNVLTIIGGDIHDPSKSYSPHQDVLLHQVVQAVIGGADAITAISRDTKQRAERYFDVGKAVDVIPLGIEAPTFRPVGRKALGLPEAVPVIAAVGRLVRRKGYDVLLEAAARLKRRDWHLVIIGDGPEENRLKRLAASLGIERQVAFRGFVSEEIKFQILNRADLFALPSLHEGFGLVFVEAMYCGLPVITTDNGGQRDFLSDGKTGYLIPVGDVDSLAMRMEALFADERMRRRIGAYNRGYAKTFLIEQVAERYRALFEAHRR